MEKLRALIIDDEPLAHEVILEYSRDVAFLEIVGQCYLATEAIPLLQNQSIDLIFLDIQMPRLKGLDFLRTLSQRPQVIITSAYEAYALESFELSVTDYLLKPFRFDRFLKALNKAHEMASLRKGGISLPTEETPPPPQRLFIKADKKHIQLAFPDIFYLESYGNYVKVWLKDAYHLTARTLSSFETELPPELFFRIHKSYMVQKQAIDYVEGNRVFLANGQELPIGKSQKQAFKDFIQTS
ncbi:MAG: LytTR family DNA-binding domain-containing protein [Bacteroidota bacterium]